MSDKLLTLLLLSVTIRRDAQTITPVTVPEHELNVLRSAHGKENIVVGEAVGTVELNPDAEFERLSSKYGQGKIVKVYGDEEGVGLTSLVEKGAEKARAALAAEKPAKADKSAKKTGDGKAPAEDGKTPADNPQA